MSSRLEWRRRGSCAFAALALAVAGCDGEEDEGAAEGGTGAGDAGEVQTPSASAPYDITVGEFIAELQPDKQRILDAFITESRACRGVEVDSSFVLLITAAGLGVDQDSPLPDLVEDQC